MNRTLHAVKVIGLLLGFYVLCLALVGGLIALDVVVTSGIGSHAPLLRELVLLYVVTAIALYIVVRGVFVSTRVRHRDVVGITVTEQDEPALWQRVRFLARSVGTRAPSRIYLVPDPNAAVWENARLLGLVPGPRNMMIGVPLLIALTPAQFDSVIAHELGHFGNRDTRFGAIDARARSSVMAASLAATHGLRNHSSDGWFLNLRLPVQAAFAKVFHGYARLVLAATQKASRREEYAADRVAASIAGHANAAAALRELPAIAAAFSFYIDRYVTRGLDRKLFPTPGQVLGGFAFLMADPARQAELDEIRQTPKVDAADEFDSHPPL
ncbi:MAG TPA: M48 family metalloprotease, partial [Micromonosporaceae bacterium]